MKITNGIIIQATGAAHFLLGISPFAFGKQVSAFASSGFFKISEGLLEFPLLNGQMNYENFAAFWFIYFGLLLIPLGIAVSYLEKAKGQLPKRFVWAYLTVILIGIYMIPLSGMTFIMLPHGAYLLYTQLRSK